MREMLSKPGAAKGGYLLIEPLKHDKRCADRLGARGRRAPCPQSLQPARSVVHSTRDFSHSP